uniref:Uncharacterized protein n=1 Tax=Octopus bimaculoides TaxID=37653 RepID=A0A0L8GYF6_OCTBM
MKQMYAEFQAGHICIHVFIYLYFFLQNSVIFSKINVFIFPLFENRKIYQIFS